MRRLARTSILASTAALAAGIGAVVLVPMASAEPEEPVGPLGSVVLESPDLVVAMSAVCDTTVKDAPEGGVVALQVKVDNVGADDASNVNVNYGALPGVQGQNAETTIKAGESATYTVPSVDREWVARPAGAAAFASALDADFMNNITAGLLSHSCIPAPAEEPAE
ncbi:Pro-kumamolisin, activation domain family protein [Rhodococcus sp. 15-649-2-2]|uniref:Pro-kumamolisin, activation domain family protein n=1 Tax=Rhodococcus sp. 15-649-2-2 TaxID=2023140 RepID=UPI000B9C3CDB|nr:Pro-kumamolisin, activation domain family protein [Rhodococcus sp. 15-649-2-2]OZE85150.1 Pro-kumamolisin, activation domain family protein [Rhodococcus sp. 15-649-2-2]